MAKFLPAAIFLIFLAGQTFASPIYTADNDLIPPNSKGTLHVLGQEIPFDTRCDNQPDWTVIEDEQYGTHITLCAEGQPQEYECHADQVFDRHVEECVPRDQCANEDSASDSTTDPSPTDFTQPESSSPSVPVTTTTSSWNTPTSTSLTPSPTWPTKGTTTPIPTTRSRPTPNWPTTEEPESTSDNKPQPTSNEPHPTSDESQNTSIEPQSTPEEPQPTSDEPQPTSDESQPTSNERPMIVRRQLNQKSSVWPTSEDPSSE